MIKLYFKLGVEAKHWVEVRKYKDIYELFDSFPLIAALFKDEPYMTCIEWNCGQNGDRRIVWEGRLTQ